MATTNEETGASDLLGSFEDYLVADSVPLAIYNDDDIYELELDRIFGRSWVFIGHESEIEEPGDYAIRYVGDSQFIFVRGEDGDCRLLFNSCRHRGAKVCKTEQGNTSHFRCPYHGWTYKNDGTLVGVTQKDSAFPEMVPEDFRLHEAPQVESYSGFVFASLDEDAPGLKEYLGESTWYLDRLFKIADWEVIGEPQRWEVDLDWKSIAENTGTDNYHLPVGHRSATHVGMGSDAANETVENTLLAIDCDSLTASIYQLHTDDDFYWGHPPELTSTFHTDELSDEQAQLARQTVVEIGTIFPNLSFRHGSARNDPNEETTGVFGLRLWRPIGPGKVQIWTWTLVPKQASEEHKARVKRIDSNMYSVAGNFLMDDIAILEGIAEAGGSTFAKKHGIATNHTMGTSSPSDARLLDDWMGPGRVHGNGTYTDSNGKAFYQKWFDSMS